MYCYFLDILLNNTDLILCYWPRFTLFWKHFTLHNTDLDLSYFDLSYAFPGHSDSAERGLTVRKCENCNLLPIAVSHDFCTHFCLLRMSWPPRMLTLKDKGGGNPPIGQDIACHFSQDHTVVTKFLDFIHTHPI